MRRALLVTSAAPSRSPLDRHTVFVDWDEWWNRVNPYGRAQPWLPLEMERSPEFRKLNLGCGSLVYDPEHGWSNMDIQPGPGIVQHDIYDIPWPFEDGEFMYVHASNILEHVCQGRWFAVLAEMFRVTADGGYWEILGPDPSNVIATLQAPSHTSLVGPWTFQGWVNRCEFGALDIARDSEAHELVPVDCVYASNRPLRWTRWYGWHLGPLSDWHLRRYLGRRLGDFAARVLGHPWTLRLVFQVKHHDSHDRKD